MSAINRLGHHRSAQIEAALKLSEDRLRMATDGAYVGLWDWNLRSDSIVCNDIYYTMIGYSPSRNSAVFWEMERLGVPG